MSNCKDDFLKETKGKDVLCAEIKAFEGYNYETLEKEYENVSRLCAGFSERELNEFLASIDYRYDSGYGGQEVFGIIWYKDGTWSERGEYDGSEWWEHKVCPLIPEELMPY